MAFNVENASGSALEIDDLGITLDTSEIIDLSVQGSFDTIVGSIQVGEEISNLILAGDLIVKDPNGGVTNLSIADGIACARALGDPNYRVGLGAILGDISDVTFSTLEDGDVLTYDSGSGEWENSPNSGFSGLGIWRYRTAITATPSAGRLQFDNITIGSATELYVNATNDGSTDMSAFLALITSGSIIYLQLQTDASQFAIVEVGTSSLLSGVYTFPITAIEYQGAAPANNSAVAFVASSTGSGGGGGDPDQNLWETITSDAGSAVANTTTDTLTIAGGTGISTAISGDTLTITASGLGTAPVAFDCYDNTGGQAISATPITLNLDTTRFDSGSGAFTLTADELTVANADVYEITFRVSTVTGNLDTRASNAFFLERDTGGGFVEVDGSRAFTYTRWTVPGFGGHGTGSVTIVLDLGAGDILRVRVVELAVSIAGNVTTMVDGSGLSVMALSAQGLQGADGADGVDGVDGATGPPGSGTTINVYEEGTIVPNSPFSELNFIGASITATDAGSGRTDITVTGGADELVKISANDTTAGFLGVKIVGVTDETAITELNDGGDEDLEIGLADNVVLPGIESVTLPGGTLLERPVSPSAGAMRFNDTTSFMEYYNGTDWITVVGNSIGPGTLAGSIVGYHFLLDKFEYGSWLGTTTKHITSDSVQYIMPFNAEIVAITYGCDIINSDIQLDIEIAADGAGSTNSTAYTWVVNDARVARISTLTGAGGPGGIALTAGTKIGVFGSSPGGGSTEPNDIVVSVYIQWTDEVEELDVENYTGNFS